MTQPMFLPVTLCPAHWDLLEWDTEFLADALAQAVGAALGLDTVLNIIWRQGEASSVDLKDPADEDDAFFSGLLMGVMTAAEVRREMAQGRTVTA